MSTDDTLTRRALAAEKTVEVLKRKVHELYNDDQSSMVRQLRAVRQREDENRRKRELAEVRAGELSRYSQTLEAEVARRTQAIKTILDHVTFGFLVVGRDLVVRPETTRSCVRLFGRDDIEGRALPALLGLTVQRSQQFELGVDQVFEDILPEEVSVAQMQQKFPLGDGRILCAEGSVIRGPAGDVDAMLFTVSDITALEEATRESHHNRTLIGILKQKDAFTAFLVETQQQLKTARAALGVGDQTLVRRVAHTIKGNAASYGLSDVVELVHGVEEAGDIGASDLDAVEEALRDFLRCNHGVIELDYGRLGDEAYVVTKDQIAQFRGILDEIRAVDGATRERLRRWTADVLARPASQLLGPMSEFVGHLAERLGKPVEFVLEGAETVVDVEMMRPVVMSLSHLLRNAVDHGIEAPSRRGAKGPTGRVSLRLVDLDGVYQLDVADDGRGIDLAQLRARALERGFITATELARMPGDGVDLIFLDGLSTAEATTHISGRGVGMSAVKAAVEGAGGTLAVATAAGRGTTFSMRFPKPDRATG